MSETMAESSVLRIVDRLSDLLDRPRLNLGHGVFEDIKNLRRNLKEIEDVWHRIPVAETVHQPVGSWMSRVQSIAGEIEDVLDEWEISMVKPKTGRMYSFFDKVLNGKATASKESERMKKVKEVIGESESLLREANLISHYATLSTSLLPTVTKKPELLTWEEPKSGIYGRRSDRNSIVKYIVNNYGTAADGEEVKVVSIVGSPGIGRSTLARLLFYHDGIEHYYMLKSWAVMKDTFDQRLLVEGILKSLSIHPADKKDLGSLFMLLQRWISGHNFFLLIDDLEDVEYSKWFQFKHSLTKTIKSRSVIVVTTTSERVASVIGSSFTHRLAPLSTSHCWLILKDRALAGKPRILKPEKKILWKVARKCNGSPLAASHYGEILGNHASEKWEELMLGTEMMNAPRLIDPFINSYNRLPLRVKRCISYCSAFPQDTVLNADRLVRLWMARGYLGQRQSSEGGEKLMEKTGIEYLNVLEKHSFFQDVVKGSIHRDKITSLKMNGLFHGFAQYMTSRGEADWLGPQKDTTCLIFSESQVVPPPLFSSYTYARALVLSSCHLEQLPTGVQNLSLLQYLDLSGNPLKQLPDTMCDLNRLQFLDVSFCYMLLTLPRRIGDIKGLKHLKINHTTNELHKLPLGFEKLTLIRTLDVIRVGGRLYRHNMQKLKALEHVEDIRIAVHGEVDFPDADFERKTDLENLELRFVGEGRDHGKASGSFNELKPPPNLQMLKLEDYPGFRLPDWILAETLINRLRRLSVRSALNLKSLPSLWKLSSLEFLWLYEIPNLKHLGCEFFGLSKTQHQSPPPPPQKKNERSYDYLSEDDDVNISDVSEDEGGINHGSEDVQEIMVERHGESTTFNSLKTLRIESLESLEAWEDGNEADEKKIKVMPSLEKLIIANCRKLKVLPSHALRNKPYLKILVDGKLRKLSDMSGENKPSTSTDKTKSTKITRTSSF